MNDLSWIIYFLDRYEWLVSAVRWLILLPIIYIIGVIAVRWISLAFSRDCGGSNRSKSAEEMQPIYAAARKKTATNVKKISVFVLLLLLVGLAPSKSAVYLIIGSEVGEEVVNTELGLRIQNELEDALDAVLDKLPDTEDQLPASSTPKAPQSKEITNE